MDNKPSNNKIENTSENGELYTPEVKEQEEKEKNSNKEQLKLTDEQLKYIKRQSENEYNSIDIDTEKQPKATKLLLVGILVMVVLIVRSMIQLDKAEDEYLETPEPVHIIIDNEGKQQEVDENNNKSVFNSELWESE